MGISGNTVRDLDSRWQTDVFDLKPDVAVITIGINDVWRQFDSPFQTEISVPLAEYEETLERLVTSTLEKGIRVILQTPFHIESNLNDAMRAMLDQYGSAVKRIASKHDLICVDTQAAFDAFLQHHHSCYLAWDRIHPTPVGTMILARAFLNAVGFSWS
jgi:lysophospholipase L1-like esterase